MSAGIGRDPGVGQEFAKLIGGMARQSFQDILPAGKRIDPMTATAQSPRPTTHV
jgi:hypothetical protein